MSNKAIWKNRNQPKKCAGRYFSCGNTSGYGIPHGKVKYHSFRIIGGKFLHPPESGQIMTQDEADKLDIESGRAVPYYRNCIRFVMSRAARKRGYKDECPFYLRKVKNNEKN